MTKSCRHLDSNPVPSVSEAHALTFAIRDLISIEHLKGDRILLECAIKIYLYNVNVVDVVKKNCRVLHFC